MGCPVHHHDHRKDNMTKYYLSKIPPSTNNLYWNSKGNKKGRIKTKQYKDWIDSVFVFANRNFIPQSTSDTRLKVSIDVVKPSNHRMDIANREKAIIDYLFDGGHVVSSNALPFDDSAIWDLRIRWVDKIELKGMEVMVVVDPIS